MLINYQLTYWLYGISFLLLALYVVLLLLFRKAWLGSKKTPNAPPEKLPSVSVIVAFRNEAHNLTGLINALAKLKYPREKLEILLVNDHSTDGYEQVLPNLPCTIKILELAQDRRGKKAAIDHGIRNSMAELIVTTDADCIFGPNWVKSLAACYTTQNASMVVAPVWLYGNGLTALVQKMEFASTQAITAGAVSFGNAIMCNAANLAFSREAYLALHNATNTKYATGDDMFLLHNIKKTGKIAFAKEAGATVQTPVVPRFSAFISQRLRWASKARGYTDGFTVFMGALVFFVNVVAVALFTCSLRNNILVFAVFIAIKYVPDWLLTYSFLTHYKKKSSAVLFFCISLVYPVYAVFIAVFSQIVTISWKGRLLKRGQ